MHSRTVGQPDIQLPLPRELPLRMSMQASEHGDYAVRIEDLFKNEDETELSAILNLYKDAGNPKFQAREWLSMIERLERVRDSTPEWREKRAGLLLSCLEENHILNLLNGAIENLKVTGETELLQLGDVSATAMYRVVDQVLDCSPQLAFRSPSSGRPAFVIAAQLGSLHIVEHAMMKLTTRVRSKPLITADRVKDEVFNELKVSDHSNMTALGLAVHHGHAKVVDALLDHEERLAGPQYLNDNNIMVALEKCEIRIMGRIRQARPDLAQRLPELIIQAGGSHRLEMWEAMAPRFEDFPEDSDILHLAVKQEQLKIIQWLVHRQPQMTSRKDAEGKIPLWHNNHQEHTSSLIKEDIRESIVPTIVRRHTPLEIQELLGSADDTPRHCCLNLTTLDPNTHDFAHFIDLVEDSRRPPSGLNDLEPAADIKFESVLRYVEFPDLSQESNSRYQAKDRDEVYKVLAWLRYKGVRTILRLIVPDCLYNPFHEDRILVSVSGLGIEELNWRRLDLCIETITDLASTVSILHLYSSGNWAVLSHWISESGLMRLGKLKELHITVASECMTTDQVERCVKRTEEAMLKLKERCSWAWDPRVKNGAWSHGTKPGKKEKPRKNLLDYESVNTAPTCVGLDHFVAPYQNIQQARLKRSPDSNLKPLRKIKIALIDTGIVAMEDRRSHDREFMPGQIKEGISFVHGADGESESHWWLPSDEHGPQMADIICSIDPYCELYPVKVANQRSLNSPQSIINGIDWAIKREVDIISMSLVLFKSHDDLYHAISRASGKGIVIICSTADKGNNYQKVYPATYRKTQNMDCLIPIAACDQFGKITEWSTETEAKYHFRGKDVTAKPVRFMRDSMTQISGSSVATAIAAGTASLILACCLLALKDNEEFLRRQFIDKFFEKMQTADNLKAGVKYVEPSILFGNDKIEGQDLYKYIERAFAVRIA